jgi:hypothetical protein
MEVMFATRDAEAGQLRDLAVRRVQFVLRRLTWLVPRASVQLSDINGPRGGVDKRCQLQFRTAKAGTVVITSVARDWVGALDGALARATPTLLRLWRKRNAQRKVDRRQVAIDG